MEPDFVLTPSCADGVQNGDETDVDCGGSCLSVCDPNGACSVGGDCKSGHCVGGLCTDAEADCRLLSLALLLEEFKAIMADDCADCELFYPYIRAAMDEANMLCPMRATSFLVSTCKCILDGSGSLTLHLLLLLCLARWVGVMLGPFCTTPQSQIRHETGGLRLWFQPRGS